MASKGHPEAQHALPARTALFQQKDGKTYRIPALIYISDGQTFLAFAEERSTPRDSDAKVLVMRRGSLQNGSLQWSPAQTLSSASLPDHRTMNPCPVYERKSKTIYLFFVCILGNTTEYHQIATVRPHALSFYSDDCGVTWQMGGKIPMKSCECEMAEIIDHADQSHLYCNARSTCGHRVEALSESSGAAFDSPHVAQKLVEPHRGCQGSVLSFPMPERSDEEEKSPNDCLTQSETKTWLLYSHPTNKKKRKDLGVYLNKSPLKTSGWGRPWIIHQGPSGYSDLTQCEERFACLMECGKKSEIEEIAFVEFKLSDLMCT
ncbi:sialidase-3-like isoform X2 [Labeo rohita]|uniref:exo-alpha-sialidase n=1 Tax=Labeo rohita TaxID=84645 RepID=A0A498N5C2_LABRO|nr:sialidase-3-like isoform X2 [Labeo rohita]